MGESVFQRSFAAGEIAPVLHARADQAKYTTELATCRNFLVRREGGVSNRAGFRYVNACKSHDAGTRLMRYVGSTPGSSYLIEMGAAYFRFYLAGGAVETSGVPAYSAVEDYVAGDLVTEGGVTYYAKGETTGNAPPDLAFWHALSGSVYEIPTPYALDALPAWNQSGNVITLTHTAHPPRELIFEGPTRWILRDVTTTPAAGVPQNLSGTAGAAGPREIRYKVSAGLEGSYEESVASGFVAVTGAEPTAAAPNLIEWDPVDDAAEYYVYADPYGNGTFGFIGTATGVEQFADSGISPDFLSTPPTAAAMFDEANEYPALSANYQQRRFFAHTLEAPDAIWGSRIGFHGNFATSSPLQDDDAISFRLAGNNHHPIDGMVALKAGLVLLTGGGEWTVTGAGGPRSPLTPSSIDALQETYFGIKPDVPPIVVGNAVIYVQARGSIVRDLQFSQQVEGLGGRDLTIFATHLFEHQEIVAVDYQQVPHSIVWCVRDDGTLLGLTYIPDQDIWGWHRHDTQGGVFEDICVVPEHQEDAVYVIVARSIGAGTVRYIERLERREIREGLEDAQSFFVDSGLSYSGVLADQFSELDHLEGEVVAVLGDGEVVFNGDPTDAQAAQFTVTGGTIELASSYSEVHIGLPIRYPEIQTLDLDVEGAAVRDKRKRVSSVRVLIHQSSRAFWAGPDTANLREYAPQAWETSADLTTGGFELNIPSTYNDTGRVVIRLTDPVPLTILGILPHVEMGG
jgi:hypothetical protein